MAGLQIRIGNLDVNSKCIENSVSKLIVVLTPYLQASATTLDYTGCFPAGNKVDAYKGDCIVAWMSSGTEIGIVRMMAYQDELLT